MPPIDSKNPISIGMQKGDGNRAEKAKNLSEG